MVLPIILYYLRESYYLRCKLCGYMSITRTQNNYLQFIQIEKPCIFAYFT